MERDFAGKNGFIWWTGVIVDRKDPANVGRCKVRIFGWHDENENKVPVSDLPWAQILLPVNNSKSISLPKEGDWVSGYFLDGHNAQMPIIMGVFPGILTNEPREVTNDSEQLKILEAQLVVEKQKLQVLLNQKTTENAGGAAFVSPNGLRNNLSKQIVTQQKVISDLESQISKIKSNLNKKPGQPWQDERKQEDVNGDPVPPSDVVFYKQNEPTISRLGRGVLEGTTINKNNNDLAHVCDFVSEMQKNINLKKYTKALANEIREMIRKVMKALGFSDATGQYSWILNTLKAFARELRRIQKEIIQPIIDFEKYVLAYITKIRAMITWLLNLPERFLKMLNDCYLKLLKLIKQVLFDTVSGFKEGLGIEVGDTILAAVDAADAFYDTVESAQIAFTGAQVVIDVATTGLLVPVNQSEVEAANTYINSYTTSSNNAIVSTLTNLQAP
jgi:hypothetical protein